jgi:hypothetical protein
MLRGALLATILLLTTGARTDVVRAQCVGDCDGNGAVAVGEIVAGVAIAMARSALGACAAMDRDADLDVSVSELTTAIGFALDGCPPAPTPTATPSTCGDPGAAARYGDCVRSETADDCASAGGEWGRHPYSGLDGCSCPTGQGDCPCSSADECLGFCIAALPPTGGLESCDDVAIGTCSALSPLSGCFCIAFDPSEGFAAICVD